MIDTTHLAVFLAASLVLSVTPGPAVLFIVARSIHYGRQAGIMSALGVGIGSLLQVCLAAFGISALLLVSTTAYTILKWVGAAYLVYLGIRALTGKGAHNETGGEPLPAGPLGIVRSGIVVNLLNPKTALFFLSFLPQFVDPSRSAAWLQTVTLGVIFVAVAACTDSLYALISGSLNGILKARRGIGFINRWVSGIIYLCLGVAAALAGGKTSK